MGPVATPDRPRPEAVVRDRLVDSLNELCDRLGCPPYGVEHEASWAGWPRVPMPSEDDEKLILGLRAAFARLADPRRPRSDDPRRPPASLGAAQLRPLDVILSAQAGALRRLLPGFAYLVVLAVSGQAEALRVSGRMADLLGAVEGAKRNCIGEY